MENSDALELEKFEKKSIGYKKALNVAPYARIHEILAIIGVIDGFIKKRNLLKSEITIVDLMSGSGYLSKFLSHNGYKKIYAIEASNFMSCDSVDGYKNISLVSIPDINSIPDTIKKINPDIIVSLASFHHMIVYEGDAPNLNESIKKQEKIIDSCMHEMNKNSILIIVDIYNDDIFNIKLDEPNYWSTNTFRKIVKPFKEYGFVKDIVSTKSIKEFSDKLKKIMPNNANNPSHDWFHKVVDIKSTIGHKDVPISKELLESIQKKYELHSVLINTPWVFRNENEMSECISWFWFSEHINNDSAIEDVIDKLKNINGVKEVPVNEYSKLVFVGWKLLLSTVTNIKCDQPKYIYKNINILLLLTISFIVVGVFLKLNLNEPQYIGYIYNILSFMIGLIFKEFYDNFKNK